jgi:CheY-like chemotaxis protein
VTSDRLADFEARLAGLKRVMERGLLERAQSFRALAARVEAGDVSSRIQLKTESHKLRGIAGTYGHLDLGELAAALEYEATAASAARVAAMAREVAALAETKSLSAAVPSCAAGVSVAAPAPAPAAAPALRVLGIDDDAVMQRLLLLTLQQVGGFDATVVGSAKEALAALERHGYDVVVSDAMMPDMNGREFRRAARARGVKLPIILLSAASPDELGWSLERQDATQWLRKPFKPSELVREILRIVAAQSA